VEDFVANCAVFRNVAGWALDWELQASISLEYAHVTPTGENVKKVFKEDFSTSGRDTFKNGTPSHFALNSGHVRSLMEGVAKRLGMRLLDAEFPPRIIAIRGRSFIVDRGRAAGMREGELVEIVEPVQDGLGTDAGFTLGRAVVRTVSEESSTLETILPAQDRESAPLEMSKSFTIKRKVDERR
jgi:hypothetical protein